MIVERPSEKSGNLPNFVGAEQQQKRLAVFLDGTWNSVDSNTNVWRMRALCASKSQDGRPQLIYYSIGVNGFLGGVFGQGLDENIRLAYEWLIENYRDGDEIFIFGFSRGAYAARALAGLIAIDGLLKAGSPIGVSELFQRYKKGDEETIWKLKEMQAASETGKMTEQERWLLKYTQPVNVKVIGVWDTVGSIDLAAGDIPGISSSSFDYLQTGLRVHILNGYHALAIDEHRAKFAATLWDVHRRDANAVIAQPRPLSGVEQRWFVGAHANVGGGYETDLLAQAPLRWMMKKAESQGLSFRSVSRARRRRRRRTDHRILQVVYVFLVLEGLIADFPHHRPGAGRTRRRHAYERQRDDRCQRVRALARGSEVPASKPDGMGAAQAGGSRSTADLGAGRRSACVGAGPVEGRLGGQVSAMLEKTGHQPAQISEATGSSGLDREPQHERLASHLVSPESLACDTRVRRLIAAAQALSRNSHHSLNQIGRSKMG